MPCSSCQKQGHNIRSCPTKTTPVETKATPPKTKKAPSTGVKEDERHSASALTKAREICMTNILNGTVTDKKELSIFPCSPEALLEFAAIFKKRYTGAGHTSLVGGLSKHYDLKTVSTERLQSELKVTKKKASPLDKLSWSPWMDTLQFLQGQLKSEIGKRFLGDCGLTMLRAWYEQHVKPFSEGIPAAAKMTYEGYEKAIFTIQMKGTQEPAAVAFINALRNDTTLKKALHKKWLSFESEWFSKHTLDHEKLKEVVKDIIEAKDAWICVSKTGAHLIGGLKVIDLRFSAARSKPKGGMSFHYVLTLTRDGVNKEVPMECKFHWKNGGQAVQNLNFMLL
jgi:hypothetical protein